MSHSETVRRRETSIRALCVQADPDFNRDSRIVTEYAFHSPGGRPSPTGNEQTHEDGKRVFKGDYQNRGPYAD